MTFFEPLCSQSVKLSVLPEALKHFLEFERVHLTSSAKHEA